MWLFVREAKARGWDIAAAKIIAADEIAEGYKSWKERCRRQVTEHQIVTARLARRFDPGPTLNEVANRAIEAKQEARRDEVHLTSRQLQALEFQKQYLERVVKNS